MGKSSVTIIVVDNRSTAMTGHQDHPGTGKTLMGEPAHEASIEEIARACGIKRVRTAHPLDLAATENILREELEADEPSLIVSRAACILIEKKRFDTRREIDPELCTGCKLCASTGCPAIESAVRPSDGKTIYRINPLMCAGCSVCEQMCKFDAIRLAGQTT